MIDLSTHYLGLALKNPVIAGASTLTADLESIQRLEEAGAAALVTQSLFEEQIQLEHFKFDEDQEKDNFRHAEMITLHPHLTYAGPAEHLMWVKKAREAVRIPVIASLNAVNRETWLEYARRLEQTGVHALECNLYASPRDAGRTAAEVEDEQVALVADLKKAVAIPVSLKLSSQYTNPLHVIRRMAEAGADGFVLFNRIFEPDLDVGREAFASPYNLSREGDYRHSMRYAGLLEGTMRADLCCSTGVHDGETVARLLLAGASTVQVVSALYRNGVGHLRTLLAGLEQWMAKRNYQGLDAFRGKLSRRHVNDPNVYTRAQYARLLMNPKEFIYNAPAAP